MNGKKEDFGTMVFNRGVMKALLPKEVYSTLQATIRRGKDLDPGIADIVANAMRDWAIEKGATHFTHWFQPMTGITAGKHDCFLSPCGDGSAMMDFSGKALIKGEPDASSLPSGGLRDTYEARGYTAWDPTSPAFIKNDTLYIPTVFLSYGGEALDKKTPLLRSMEAVSEQALRILRLFGNEDVQYVTSTVGGEQEYFLIEEALYAERLDLKFTGRTLFGAKPIKGQEMEDHYFGAIKPRVMRFMRDLDRELWKLGIPAKTEHNETAPAQHELAPIFEDANVSTDHNQLTMEIMQQVAKRHGLVCLLHEKPFAGVNGSGKHNNWSLSTDTGINLLDPGKSPIENKQFLLFLVAVIKAVDKHQDLMRLSAASAGNDHRLGGNEAPPAIVSIFLGDELTSLLEALANKEEYLDEKPTEMEMGVHVLPNIPKDNTDRNRTSPFAFTGNKFEFRMLGASFSLSGPNIVLNTIVADQLQEFADELSAAEDFDRVLRKLVRRTIREHRRIIFNGNNYAGEWVQEAESRGLLNLKNTVDALPVFIAPENIALFTRHGVYTEKEIRSRFEILMGGYSKVIRIEASTMLKMARRSILPAASAYGAALCEAASAKKALGLGLGMEPKLAAMVSELASTLYDRIEALAEALHACDACGGGDVGAVAIGCRDRLLPAMAALRETADALECIVAEEYWPFPGYDQLLFGV